MKIRKINRLIKTFEQSSLQQLEITIGKMKISMQKPLEPVSSSISQKELKELRPSGESHWIHSPLVGTFYIRMTQDCEPLVTVGKYVKKNEILCVIETMKVFNEIKAPFDGVITHINVDDGGMVEYHQPIICIRCHD
ncbi:MAG: biotin/lipoyl-containing protein [Erysipelotrichaceae bacterium]|nr:biotin/lipoyl-containing protein [Erysipelotrichaceae bacterium]